VVGDKASASQGQAFEVADRLHSAAIHLLRRVRKQDVASGIGPAQLSALSVLVFGGPMTLGELAAAEQVRPPTISRIAAALLRQKLVERVADPSDARRVRIRATGKGAQLMLRGRRRRIVYLAGQMKLLTPGELRRLGESTAVLERLLRDWDRTKPGSSGFGYGPLRSPGKDKGGGVRSDRVAAHARTKL
jgi:DNA-binding MarR family transcriptional regulator